MNEKHLEKCASIYNQFQRSADCINLLDEATALKISIEDALGMADSIEITDEPLFTKILELVKEHHLDKIQKLKIELAKL